MGLLRCALSGDPLNRVVLEGLDHLSNCRGDAAWARTVGWADPSQSRWVLPRSWCTELPAGRLSVLPYDHSRAGGLQGLDDPLACPWILVTDGRFATCLNRQLLARALETADADVIAVNADASLLAYRERIRLTQNEELVGYRRLFADAVAAIPAPVGWPHHLLVRPRRLKRWSGRICLPTSASWSIDAGLRA